MLLSKYKRICLHKCQEIIRVQTVGHVEAPFLANMCMLTKDVLLQIFSEVVNFTVNFKSSLKNFTFFAMVP